MTRQWTWMIASMAVMTIILLLLFPVSFGPYNATHGPTTDLRDTLCLELLLVISALCAVVNNLSIISARANSLASGAAWLISEDSLTSAILSLAIRC